MSADAVYSVLHPEDGPGKSLLALADTLSEMAACAFSIASGEIAEAAAFHLEASVAAGDAFPFQSAESRALSVLLTSLGAGRVPS